MFPLRTLDTPGSEVVLYAGTAGAFVDLAADLAYALGTQPDAVRLDQHLVPPDPASDAAGLTGMSRRHQAIGILLDRGHDTDDAVVELHRLARVGFVSVDVAAQQLLDSSRRPPPP